MKKKLLRLMQAAVFFALLAFVLVVVGRVVERKYSRQKLAPYLEAAQSYDVLLLGDSHMVNAVYPLELWKDYGIASYNLAGYGNSLAVSYWVLMNALDYATPKLVVLDIKDVERNTKITGSSGDLHNALDAFPLTPTKVRAIEDIIDNLEEVDEEGHYYVDIKWEYYLPFGKYHGRWNQLSSFDFQFNPTRQRGAEMLVGVANPREYEITDEEMEEHGWGFSYLRMIIEACRSRGIGLLLTHMPHPAKDIEQMGANAVQNLAWEYDLNYIDYVHDDQVVDYTSDMYDSYSHLNASGAWKVTDYLGRYIRSHYGLPDRRGDPAYAAWDADYDIYTGTKLKSLVNQQKLDSALMLMHDSNLSVCISVAPESPVYDREKTLNLLHNIVREHVYEEDGFGKWSNAIFPLEGLEEAAAQGERYFLLLDRKTGMLRECVGDGQPLREETSFGWVTYDPLRETPLSVERGEELAAYPIGMQTEEMDGVQVLVVDSRTDGVAASLSF
ncbi:MAG: hypothetical protein ACI4PG_08040 [Candidatus Ventricola sp.]